MNFVFEERGISNEVSSVINIMRVSLSTIRLHYDSAYFKETIQHETMHFFENYMRV